MTDGRVAIVAKMSHVTSSVSAVMYALLLILSYLTSAFRGGN